MYKTKGDDVIGYVTLLWSAFLLTVTKLVCYWKSSQRGLKHNGVSHFGLPGYRTKYKYWGSYVQFAKSGSLGTSAISRCFKRKETKIWMWIDIFIKYTFLLFLMMWRHRSRDQNGPNFNIFSKSLLEPFSKNIKESCSLINSVLENGHDYFFLKKCGSRKPNWKVCQLPAQRPFELATKENFPKGLSVCSEWRRCQFFQILIGLGGDRRFFLKRNEWGLGESKGAAQYPLRWDLPSGFLVVRNAGS